MKTSIARRYARALFALAWKDKQLKPVRLGLDLVDRIIRESPQIEDLCRNPIYGLQEKQRVLENMVSKLEGPTLLNRFLHLLAQKKRLPCLSDIRKIFDDLVDEAEGRENIQVRVAKKLSPKQETTLQKQMEEFMRRTVNLTVEVDHSLIGGIIVYAGGWIYDGSIRGQLQELRRGLMAGHGMARS